MDSLRFRYDRAPSTSGCSTKQHFQKGGKCLLEQLLHKSVLVRDETFPRLSGILNKVTRGIPLDIGTPDLFVRPNPEVQACCFPSSGGNPILLVTSSLVERLNENELASVLGHEIGHWIFGHTGTGFNHGEGIGLEQLKALAASRCAEISADRVGLISCGNLDSALSALIKVSTGLDEKNLRLDVQSFLKQYKSLVELGPSSREVMSTHPLFLIRIRALVLFSRSSSYYKIIGNKQKVGIPDLETDESIYRDLRKISGLSIDEIDDELVTEILLLASFLVFAQDGKFSKEEQAFISEIFGKIDLNPYLSMISESGLKGLDLLLRQKIRGLGGVSSANRDRMTTFFSVLTNNFPTEHTTPLQSTLNSLGFAPNDE